VTPQETRLVARTRVVFAAMFPFPLQFLLLLLLLLLFAGWVNRRQLDAIEYLKEENRVLKERLGERRIRFTDARRSEPLVPNARPISARSDAVTGCRPASMSWT